MQTSAFVWEEARDAQSREEVYHFRYEQYFARHEYLPGTDHAARRVWLPHDDASWHFLARASDGKVLAVGTATPASEPSLLAEWIQLLDLPRLGAMLPRTTIISRTIIAQGVRHSALFGDICLRLARFFLDSGYHYALHYCTPRMVAMYERLGYRQYGQGGNLKAGVFRVPMFLVADDMRWFTRLRSPFRVLNRDLDANRHWIDKAFALCPELTQAPLCSLSEADVAAYLHTLCPALKTAASSLFRTLRRGSLLNVPAGAVLAPQGIDEGTFLLLSGKLSCDSRFVTPGSFVQTGGYVVRAENHACVVCAKTKGSSP
ncbi:MAG: hypothetical protein IJU37_05030 [Desulfovibrio sp.]|nr:hypothetical protein [Desulfovibrio sp.]